MTCNLTTLLVVGKSAVTMSCPPEKYSAELQRHSTWQQIVLHFVLSSTCLTENQITKYTMREAFVFSDNLVPYPDWSAGLYDSIYNHFDEPDLLDDVTDHWYARYHLMEHPFSKQSLHCLDILDTAHQGSAARLCMQAPT